MWGRKEEYFPANKVTINPSYEWVEGARELGISHRELEVFALLYEGHNNKEIAAILGIQHQSVKNHLYSLTKKINSKNVAQAFVFLIVKNMIKMEIPVMGFQMSKESWFEDLKKMVFDETDHRLPEKKKKIIRSIFMEQGIYGDFFKDRAKELEKED